MALNYSNLLTPNKNVQNLYGSLTQKTPAQSALSSYLNPQLISPPVGSKSVGAVGASGGYDTAVGSNPVKKVENKNTGITTHYDTAQKSTSSPGSYKGVAITPGSDAQVQAQMAKIDNPAAQTQTNTSTQAAPVTATTQQPQQQNQQPQTTYGGLVGSLVNRANDTTAVDNANQALLKLRQDYATATGNIESTPIPLVFQQGRNQILGRQYAAQEAAAQSALSNALTERGQTLGAIGQAAGFASPRSADIYVDPLTGQPIGDINNLGGAMANWNAIRSTANTAGNFASDYQSGLANLRAADTIGQQIISTLKSNPTLNNQPLSGWTNIKQFLAGQTSEPSQQLLAQQVAQYITTLGIDPNSINLAGQEQKTLGQLLDSLRAQANAQVESKNPSNVINSFGGNTSGGGGLYDF